MAPNLMLSGVRLGLFLSKYQRSASPSLIRDINLTSRPVWTLEQTGYARQLTKLVENYQEIRAEGLKALLKNEDFAEEARWIH